MTADDEKKTPEDGSGLDGSGQDAAPAARESHDGDTASSHSVDDDSITEAPRRTMTRVSLDHVSTHPSLGPDNTAEPYTSCIEIPDEVYDRFSKRRKLVFVALLSFCSFLAPISSTSVLSATPEVSAEFNTTGTIINLANALYLIMMGLSPIVWGPLCEVFGRQPINRICSVIFCGASIGTALAPNLAAFFIFRILTAFEGTAFILVGSACISDIYRPTERATALGWFLSGTLIGPAFGPFLGGIIVTYTSWRVIFWLQTGLSVVAVIGTFTLLPETLVHRKIDDLEGYNTKQKARVLWSMINPWRVMRLFVYPNLLVASLASSAIIWNMYSLLTPIRYVLNPRFNLTTPMLGGLFYLAPGCGYLVGTFGGGRYADYIVRTWMGKRGGVRVPEDRLRSAVPFMGIVIPACMLIYGWSVEREVGGIALPVIVLFFQGVAQLFCFPSLNTYCLDVMQGQAASVVAGNYFSRYMLAAGGTAVVLPAVEAIGVGWFSTISALFVAVSAAAMVACIHWGQGWRNAVDARRRAKRVAQNRRVREDLEKGSGETPAASRK
ncbi:MFS general substrate transporter [Thozetella sp. PMI_491]|nr:MFS general substrate transporter [Thozetella sp. PMI_491]